MKLKSFLKCKWVAHSFIAGALVLLLLFASLPGCVPAAEEEGPPPEEDAYEEYVASLPEGCLPVPRDCFEQAMEEGQLNIYDWAEWWPEEMYTNFDKEFGFKMVRDNYADYDEITAKFKLNPNVSYDMITGLATRDVVRLQTMGVLQEINYDWLPNVVKYIADNFKGGEYNPSAEYAVYSAYSYTTYAYNTKYVDDPRLPSLAVLLEPDEKYKGRVTMVDDMYLTIGAALIYLGYRIDSDDEEELMEARDLLMRQKPYVMAYDWWPKRVILEEEAWIAQLGCGDSWAIHQELETVEKAIPPEGVRMAQEIMIIPIGSEHPAVAHMWLNYVQRPQVNALMCEAIGYTPCNLGAPQYMSEEVRKWISVPEAYLDKIQVVGPSAYTGKGLELRSAIWEELKR